jgi:hypothetical protein
MPDIKCPQCDASLPTEEIKTKCESSVHLFKLTVSDTVATPATVVIQCPNGHLVEVECPEVNKSHA